MSNKFIQHPSLPQGFSVTFERRFWKKVNKDGPVPSHCPELGCCWVWTAGVQTDGYGSIGIGKAGVSTLSHRASWLIHFGEIPDGMQVLHRCDNPPCVNPSHLFLGTQIDNIRDRDKKGRGNGGSPPGELCGSSKLRKEQVIEIRRRYATGKIIQNVLADIFKTRQANISAIIRMKTWRNLP